MPDPRPLIDILALMSTREVATALGVTTRVVQQTAQRHGVEPAARVGQAYLWRPSDLERLRPKPRGRPREYVRVPVKRTDP